MQCRTKGTHIRQTAANSEENWIVGKSKWSTGEHERLDLAARNTTGVWEGRGHGSR
jgi:hypothetical protein